MRLRKSQKEVPVGFESWMTDASCKGIPTEESPLNAVTAPEIEMAKRLCAGCDVAEFCLNYALEMQIDKGVWGGKSVEERQAMLAVRNESST